LSYRIDLSLHAFGAALCYSSSSRLSVPQSSPFGIWIPIHWQGAEVNDEESENDVIIAPGIPLPPFTKRRRVQRLLVVRPKDDEEDSFGEDTGDELTSQKEMLHWLSLARVRI